ncbi:hypothetical protein NEDG_00083 [Nematocida displodere]|uniref:Ras-GEF domain-containing protein n=1 Tax=Nematocida displodere TaxID=1805483 RepID=A0A177EIA1_9MICR|nr:hypothetical protein NEDG_00083 [Nematocida displodere]
MQSDYTKEKLRLEEKLGKSRSDKAKDPDHREISAKISEAEAMDLYQIDEGVLAREITTAEIKVLIEMPPTEILKFDPTKNFATTSPTFYGYIKYTEGLSSLVAATINSADVKHTGTTEKETVGEKGPRKASDTAQEYQRFWLKVLKELKGLSNINASHAVIAGLKRTRLSKILLEELKDAKKAIDPLTTHQAQETLQKGSAVYVRDIAQVEKYLIDASVHKEDKEAAKKFCSIIEYLQFIRKHADLEVDKKVNHKIITSALESKDQRIIALNEPPLSFSGSFLFLGHSNFTSGQ